MPSYFTNTFAESKEHKNNMLHRVKPAYHLLIYVIYINSM